MFLRDPGVEAFELAKKLKWVMITFPGQKTIVNIANIAQVRNRLVDGLMPYPVLWTSGLNRHRISSKLRHSCRGRKPKNVSHKNNWMLAHQYCLPHKGVLVCTEFMVMSRLNMLRRNTAHGGWVWGSLMCINIRKNEQMLPLYSWN